MTLIEKLRPDLDSTGKPWLVKNGNRHLKIYVGGRLVGVIPRVSKGAGYKRAYLNLRAQIRRAGVH